MQKTDFCISIYQIPGYSQKKHRRRNRRILEQHRGDLKVDKRKSINIVKEFANHLKQDFEIKKLIFFGSRASGRPHKDSDIDLIIVSDDFREMNVFERNAKMYDYWPWLIAVDFICYTAEEFNILRKRISIVSEALKEGIIILSSPIKAVSLWPLK